jgi:hypothetical protein
MPICLHCKCEYEQSEWASYRVRKPKYCSPQCKALWWYYENKAKAAREAAKPKLVFDRDRDEARYASR